MAKAPIDDQASPDEIYETLIRSLRRRKGFGLVFVNCTPVRGTQLIEEIRRDLPQKQVGVMALTEPVETLRDLVAAKADIAELNILVITGLEKSLEADIKPGYGGNGDYYNLNTVPPILAHLNQQRENFRDRFDHLCFVFLLPIYAIKYIVRRAPDFFDWGTGVVELPTDEETTERKSGQLFGDYHQYLTWTQTERDRRILQIQTWLAECKDNAIRQSELFFEQGNLFAASQRLEEAIASYDKAIAFKPDMHKAWSNRGLSLDDLGRREEAIASYDKAIAFRPNMHEAWSNRGVSLDDLGRREEAIVSYDKALEFKPDFSSAMYNKACSLSLMGDRDGALEWLKKAIALDAKYREMAKTDEDFSELRDDPRFQKLVQL
ncbi:MAG: tetratricopeptide repeat protein [Cyanobacteria bacterium P01_F01_bin.150]